MRVLRDATRRQELLAISAITLLEIAVLFGRAAGRNDAGAEAVLEQIESGSVFQIIPFTIDIAAAVAALGRALGDPDDRAIVSTARVHRLKLVTSEKRIIASGLVPVVG
jgi:PIN domain nuclease of toxin-antitoxin system